LTSKLKEKDCILKKLKDEFIISEEKLKSIIKEKEIIIDNLNRELHITKCERDDSINQIQNLYGKNKISAFRGVLNI